VLAQRQLCDQQALGDLFGTSRGTIRNAIDDVLPLLEQDGYIPTYPTRHFATAAGLLAFATTAHRDETPR
jgi:DNA-binding GntR family transcriptional regulator